MSTRRTTTRGMAISDKLATVFGPPQVGDCTEPLRDVTPKQKERAEEVVSAYTRVMGPDGTVRLEPRRS